MTKKTRKRKDYISTYGCSWPGCSETATVQKGIEIDAWKSNTTGEIGWAYRHEGKSIVCAFHTIYSERELNKAIIRAVNED